MDDRSQVQAEPPNRSKTAVPFPLHRRRPILSRTYRTLVEILSHCGTTSPQLQTQVNNGHTESRPGYDENIKVTNIEVTSSDLLVPLSNCKDSGNKLVQGAYIGEKKESFGRQEGGSSDEHAEQLKLDHINLTPDGKQEIAPASASRVVDLSMIEKQNNDCAIQIFKEQIANGNDDIQMGDLGTLDQLEVDKEFSVSDFSEILDSCFGMDMVVQSSDVIEGSQENGTVSIDMHKKSEHELQLKEMELEKLIYNSSVVTPHTNDDIEEGEISGDLGDIGASLDAFSEDAESWKEKNTETVDASHAAPDEEFICDGVDNRHMQYEMSDPSLIEIVNSSNICTQVKSGTTAGQMQDGHLEIVSCDRNTNAQNSDFIGPYLENGTLVDKITQQNASEIKISDSTRMDEDMERKKRKRGPSSKERRAKKKKKERIKRAEKNRKLGVKRLKLPPVIKQKKIVYCRHFLQGRCHEGEKCNFSHDTVPLTKSKPCGHFARHSCMKGDDCPFDHELSKYPCKNYTENGFCSRGSDCLFSHEVPAKQSSSAAPNISKTECTSVQHTVSIKEGSSTASKVTKPEVKLPSPLNYSNSSKTTNKHGLFSQKIDAKSSCAGKSPRQNSELATAPAGKAPKGVSFLLNAGLSLADSSGSRQGGSSLNMNDGVDVGCKTAQALGSTNKLNETSERAAPTKPRGINFLSFARPPFDDSSSDMFSNLLSNSNIEKEKSVMEDSSKGKLAGSFLESVGTLKVNGPMNQSPMPKGVNENVNVAPMTALQNINCSLFNKILPHVSKEQGDLLASEGNAASSFIKERQGSSSQLHDFAKVPSLSFKGPGIQSTGHHNADSSGSSKKPYLSNAPISVQKTVRSTLAMAAKFESAIKVGLPQRGS